jgi:hypothetical protein
MRDPKQRLNDAIGRIRRTTVEALSAQPKLAKPAAQILKDIDVVESAVQDLARDLAIDNPRSGKPRKSEVISHYTVEPMPSEGQVALTEHRTSGAQPFRCPKETYFAVAKIIAGAMAPMKFNDLQSAADSRMRRAVPAYQLRLCLRFWATAGLLQHRRARFAPQQPSGFEVAAGNALKTVASRPLVIG